MGNYGQPQGNKWLGYPKPGYGPPPPGSGGTILKGVGLGLSIIIALSLCGRAIDGGKSSETTRGGDQSGAQ